MSQVPPFSSDVVREERISGAGGDRVVAPAGTVIEPAAADGTYTRVSRTSSLIGNPEGWRAVQIVWFLLACVETVIGLRIVLLALGANPSAGFTRFIHDISGPFVAPFTSMFGTTDLGSTGILEVGAIVAMVVYLLAAWLLVRLVDILSAPRGRSVA